MGENSENFSLSSGRFFEAGVLNLDLVELNLGEFNSMAYLTLRSLWLGYVGFMKGDRN